MVTNILFPQFRSMSGGLYLLSWCTYIDSVGVRKTSFECGLLHSQKRCTSQSKQCVCWLEGHACIEKNGWQLGCATSTCSFTNVPCAYNAFCWEVQMGRNVAWKVSAHLFFAMSWQKGELDLHCGYRYSFGTWRIRLVSIGEKVNNTLPRCSAKFHCL